MKSLQAKGVAASTRRTYAAGLRVYLKFCTQYSLTPLPANELTLRYFCTHLSSAITFATLKVYLSAIRLHHLEQGYPDPTKDTPLLKYLCRAIQREQSHTSHSRKPICLSHLKAIKLQLAKSSISAYDKLAYWAAFTLAFFGFLRASEFTAKPTTFDTQCHLLASHVSIHTHYMQVTLPHSKTNQFGKPQCLSIGATNTSTCPVRAMTKFLYARKAHAPQQTPLFTMSTGRFLTRQDVSSRSKSLLEAAGYDPTFYSSHSYRIGAATTAAASGLPDHLIQQLGRWRSDAYKGYVRPPQRVFLACSTRMAKDQ